MLIFHVDMDSFFASCEQQANPKLRGIPIAVSGDPKSRTVVAAASKEAKRFGVRSAMTIGEARSLCPQIQFVLGDPDKYVEVSRRVIAILGSFTPDVEVFSIDEAFLDVTGWCEQWVCTACRTDVGEDFIPSRTEGARMHQTTRLQTGGDEPRPYVPVERMPGCGAVHLAQEIKRRIAAEVGEWITCSIGIAPNKRLAKLASDFKKPNGLVLVYDDVRGPPVVHPVFTLPLSVSGRGGEEVGRNGEGGDRGVPLLISRSELLSQLKLRDLCGIGPRIEARLHGLGITTVGGLAAAPLDLLVEEFGVYGYELHDMAMGYDDSSVVAEDAEPKSMGHATTLPKDLKTLDEIRPVVEELSEKVAARLRRHGYRGSTIHATLRFRDFTSRSEQTTIADATDDGLRISREVMRIISGWIARRGGLHARSREDVKSSPTVAHEFPQPIRLIGVSVGKLTRATPAQEPLFPRDQRWQAAIHALDAANDRYGEWTVQRASLLASERVLRKTIPVAGGSPPARPPEL